MDYFEFYQGNNKHSLLKTAFLTEGLSSSLPLFSPNRMQPRTKWEVLNARLEELRDAASKLAHNLEALQNTPCGITCSGCGTYLATEADFQAHFIIPDERYLNLGDCPNPSND